MPRSRSSGALSIESNARNDTFGLFFDSTFVIAAVNVVLPWSMCPIVPTFKCGLLRSNFSFAIAQFLRARLSNFIQPELWLQRVARRHSHYFLEPVPFFPPMISSALFGGTCW